VSVQGGTQALELRVAEQYVSQFGELAKEANTLVIPANLSDVSSMLAMATKILKHDSDETPPPPPARPRRELETFDDL